MSPAARASVSISVTFRCVALPNSPRRNAIASALAELKPGAFRAVNSRGLRVGFAGANAIVAAFSRRTMPKASVPRSCGGSPTAARHRHRIDGDQPQVLDPLDQWGE